MEPAGDEEAPETNPPTIIFDHFEGIMDEFRFRILHPVGAFFNGRLPVYKAAVFHRTGPHYLGLTIEDMFVAVKRIRTTGGSHGDFMELRRQAEINRAVMGDGNIIRIERPFFYAAYYYVVFPFMSMGSMRYILKTKFPDGMPEDCVLVILREALKGLLSIHSHGIGHNSFNSGCIFLNRKPEIKIAFSAAVYTPTEEVDLPSSTSALPDSGICTWGAAPEVYKNRMFQVAQRSDIWMVGITALELACGGLNVADRRHLDIMTKKINKERRLPRPGDEMIIIKKKYAPCLRNPPENRPVSFAVRSDFSQAFEEMVALCLERSPMGRPTVDQLLDLNIFRELGMTVLDFYNLMRDRPVIQGY